MFICIYEKKLTAFFVNYDIIINVINGSYMKEYASAGFRLQCCDEEGGAYINFLRDMPNKEITPTFLYFVKQKPSLLLEHVPYLIA